MRGVRHRFFGRPGNSNIRIFHRLLVVLVKDAGTRFDASPETVWKLLSAHASDMSVIHPWRKGWSVEFPNDHTLLGIAQEDFRGKPVAMKVRFTMFPPLGFTAEFLEGVLAGTRWFQIYETKGDQVETTILGDFQSPLIPDAELEPWVRGWLDQVWKEDLAYLSRIQGDRARPAGPHSSRSFNGAKREPARRPGRLSSDGRRPRLR